MSFIGALSPEARLELDAFVRDAIRRELAARERAEARQEWLTTEDAAELLGASENAIRCRIRRGWLDGDVTRDGKRLLVRKAALLDELDRRAGL
jgi:hypothetical protein